MAEHEAEMQRQMMSVPGNQMLNVPPPPIPGITHPPLNVPMNASNQPPPNVGFTAQNDGLAPPPPPPGFNLNDQPNWNADEVDQAVSKVPPPLMSVKVDKPDEIKSKKSSELVLPKALEDVLAFKDQLADELGRTDGEIPLEPVEKVQKSTGVISTDYADADADSEDDDDVALDMASGNNENKAVGRASKNKKKKQRKKENKKKRQEQSQLKESKHVNGNAKETNGDDGGQVNGKEPDDEDDDVTIEYVPDKLSATDLGPMYRQFFRVFEMFKLEEKVAVTEEIEAEEKTDTAKKDMAQIMDDEDEDMDDEKDDGKEKMSKRKMKKLTRLSVAELKQLVNRPDVVEMHDITARDPKLLVQLKAHRNTVQVPRHWCFKRKYLQGKRGIEKPPFDLPAFIKKTGIMEMRASLQEKDESKTLKAKMRERVRPKMGKIDIDYQKLHDAFFK